MSTLPREKLFVAPKFFQFTYKSFRTHKVATKCKREGRLPFPRDKTSIKNCWLRTRPNSRTQSTQWLFWFKGITLLFQQIPIFSNIARLLDIHRSLLSFFWLRTMETNLRKLPIPWYSDQLAERCNKIEFGVKEEVIFNLKDTYRNPLPLACESC